MSDSNSKVCRVCGSTDFNTSGQCRPCQKARSARYYDLNKQKMSDQRRAWYTENKEAALQKAAAWAAANPEKVKATKTRWAETNPDKRKKAWRDYVANNPDKARESGVKYRSANRDKIKETSRKYYRLNIKRVKAYHQSRYMAHYERIRCEQALWEKAHPEVGRLRTENRRARKLAAGGQLSPGLATRLYAKQKGLCACCGVPLEGRYHMDHIMPLYLGGSNTDDNIQLLLPRCNMEKGSMHPDEFMGKRQTSELPV